MQANKQVISIQDRLKEKVREAAGEIEGWLDDFCIDRKTIRTTEDFVNLYKSFELKAAHMAHIAKDYSKNTTLLDILYFTADENQQVANFIKENIKKLTDSILSAQSKIKQLIIEADKLKWAAPFRRYTQLGYVLNHLNSYLSTFTSIARSS